MATFRKYEFAVYADFRTINDLEAEPRSVVELGHINEQNPKAWCVDILWEGDEPKLWEKYQTWPRPCGVHAFAGWEEQYTEDYNANKPKTK
jgi:hypothetical protein